MTDPLANRPPAPPPPRGILLPVLGILSIAVGIAVVYGGHVVIGGFLNFDDNLFFRAPDNEAFAEAGIRGLLDPAKTIANVFLPVAHLSLHADLVWFGGAPWVAHLHSAVLHLVATLALVYWLRQLLPPKVAGGAAPGRWAPWAAGLVFAVHPALVESVAWAASRKDVLAGLFTFLALGLLAAATRRGRTAWWQMVLIALCAVLALYSKGTALVLPLLAGITVAVTPSSLTPSNRGGRRPWLAVGVVTLATVAVGWHHFAIAQAEGTMAVAAVEGARVGVLDRLVQVPGALAHYAQTAVWPADLNILYPELNTLDDFAAHWLVATMAIVPLLAIGVVCTRSRRWRAVGAGVLLFFAAVLPFNTAFPASAVAAADRYLYLALPGLALALACIPRVGAVLATAVGVVLMFAGQLRTWDFADSGAVWRASLAQDPANAVAHINLASHLATVDPEDLAGPTEHLQQAVAVARYPQHALRAHERLRMVRFGEGAFEAACRHAEGAVDAAEDLLDGLRRDGVEPRDVLRRLGDREAAERMEPRVAQMGSLWLQARLAAFRPYIAAAERARNQGLERQARTFERIAETHLEAARQATPDHPDVVAYDAMLDLAEVAGDRTAEDQPGTDEDPDPRLERAAAAAERILAAFPDHFAGRLVAGRVAQLQGRKMAALGHFISARNARPFDAEGWLYLCQYYLSEGLVDSAVAEVEQALFVYKLRDPSLLRDYALALIERNELAKAERTLADYVKLRPGDRDVARMLGIIIATRAMAEVHQAPEAEIRRMIERARSHNPGEPRLHAVEGQLALRERRFGDAIGHFEAARLALPNRPEVMEWLTEARMHRGWELKLDRTEDRTDAAMEVWREAVAEAPPGTSTDAVRGLMRSHGNRLVEDARDALGRGDGAAAVAALRRARQLAPRVGSFELGVALLQLADTRRQGLERLANLRGPLDGSDRQLRLLVEEAVGLLGDVAAAASRDDVADTARYYQVVGLVDLGRLSDAREAAAPVLDREGSAVRADLERVLDRASGR